MFAIVSLCYAATATNETFQTNIPMNRMAFYSDAFPSGINLIQASDAMNIALPTVINPMHK